MRKFFPSAIAVAVALALASGAALAQMRISTSTANPTPGSTVTSSTTTATVGVGGDVSAPAPAATAPQSNVATDVGTPVRRDPDAPNAATLATRQTPNNANATPMAAALGRSQGQTSSGTAGAASTTGVVPGIDQQLGLGATTPIGAAELGGGFSSGVVVPGVSVGGFGTAEMTTATAGGGIGANGERFGGGLSAATSTASPASATPIFNATAAQGAARIAARRARGEEPRIYGIAPRTDRDLTHQMPDDPIIRY